MTRAKAAFESIGNHPSPVKGATPPDWLGMVGNAFGSASLHETKFGPCWVVNDYGWENTAAKPPLLDGSPLTDLSGDRWNRGSRMYITVSGEHFAIPSWERRVDYDIDPRTGSFSLCGVAFEPRIASEESQYLSAAHGMSAFQMYFSGVGRAVVEFAARYHGRGREVLLAARSRPGSYYDSNDATTKPVFEPELQGPGLAQLCKRVDPVYQSMLTASPVHAFLLCKLFSAGGKTVHGVKVSKWLNSVFDGGDEEGTAYRLIEAVFGVTPALKFLHRNDYGTVGDGLGPHVPGWKELRKEAIARGGDRAFKKLTAEAESLGLDPGRTPLLCAAVESGEIPVSAFFRKSEQVFVFNSNWELWEEMLAAHREFAVEAAKEVSGRTTYGKDVMSYFYFVLRGLPEYLERHTGRRWTCIPKMVLNSSELEMEEPDASGVTRKRSALTPVADNEAGTVVVPYASFVVSGYRTQYCYSQDYHLLRPGFSFGGNAVMREVERLNGRDDYGLMFYTLTGTDTARGYPTFLTIFERRPGGVHVHFHRVKPNRSKDGEYAPVHAWIRNAFNWMVGNVSFDRITAQQGDMVLVRSERGPGPGAQPADAFDGSHLFSRPVDFEPTPAKGSNLVGLLRADEPFEVSHREHVTIQVPAGSYELYQCRSFEANPVAIMTRRID